MLLNELLRFVGLAVQVPLPLVNPTKGEAVTKCLSDAKVPISAKGDTNWAQDHTTYNLRLQFEPVAIAVPTTVAQISAAVLCGKDNGVAVSAKSGGHGYTSLGFGGEDGHLMLELDRMFNVTLASDGTARVQPGARLGHVATELYNQGKRAISHGTCPGVGVGGHALHGGYGLVSRKYGLALDWIIGATVVLYNGIVVECSETLNPNLFWAIRGAGASFGVVAELRFKTFPAPENVTYFNASLNWKDQQTVAQGLLKVQDFGDTMPSELTMQAAITSDTYSLDGAYVGDVDGLHKAIDPLLSKLGAQLADAKTVGWLDFVKHFAGTDDVNPTSAAYDAHDTFYVTSLTAPALSQDQFKSFSEYVFATGKRSNHSWWIQMDIHGGQHSAVSKPKPSDTAYVHRDKLLLFQIYDSVKRGETYPVDGFSLLKGFRESITKSMPDGSWGLYANYPDSQLSSNEATTLYWGKNLPHLVSNKTLYDPFNLFRSPQSIKPKTA